MMRQRRLRQAGLGVVLVLAGARGHAGEFGIPAAERRSGFEMMSAEVQALQREDLANPAMLWAREGEKLWNAEPGEEGRACSGCHGAPETMRGVAARYPAFDATTGGALDLAGRIQQCRSTRQNASRWARESQPLLAMTMFVGLQSRRMPITPPEDRRLDAARARGQALFSARLGQLNLACASCHDANWGHKLGASIIPQAHPTAYPIYRLEWQGVGSLQRRLRNCLAGVRAEPFAYGAPELVDLELYLMQRAAGMTLETPGVRP